MIASGMTREEKESEIRSLRDQRWLAVMQTFANAREVHLWRFIGDRFEREVADLLESHYDELLDRILDLSSKEGRHGK
jgi:hypothetical protein